MKSFMLLIMFATLLALTGCAADTHRVHNEPFGGVDHGEHPGDLDHGDTMQK